MAFGVLFDFIGSSNVSKVIKAADLVKKQWFLNALHFQKPIDLFVVIGHNPPRRTAPTSSFGLLYDTIRQHRPKIPITVFGGHTHIRFQNPTLALVEKSDDFAEISSFMMIFQQVLNPVRLLPIKKLKVLFLCITQLNLGRYCETLGWLSMSGIQSPSFSGKINPYGPNPTRRAIKVLANGTARASGNLPSLSSHVAYHPSISSAPSAILYSRRYLDWNRLTFSYHAVGSQDWKFDYNSGRRVTNDIADARKALNLSSSSLFGCVPRNYCQYCKQFGSEGNIFTLLETALGATVINKSRANIPRLVIINTGSIRFDLVEGPFTLSVHHML